MEEKQNPLGLLEKTLPLETPFLPDVGQRRRVVDLP
jgi:hypothetical protein